MKSNCHNADVAKVSFNGDKINVCRQCWNICQVVESIDEAFERFFTGEEVLKYTPERWQKFLPEVVIVDDDGWRDGTWHIPITREEYLRRRANCTCHYRSFTESEGTTKTSKAKCCERGNFDVPHDCCKQPAIKSLEQREADLNYVLGLLRNKEWGHSASVIEEYSNFYKSELTKCEKHRKLSVWALGKEIKTHNNLKEALRKHIKSMHVYLDSKFKQLNRKQYLAKGSCQNSFEHHLCTGVNCEYCTLKELVNSIESFLRNNGHE